MNKNVLYKMPLEDTQALILHIARRVEGVKRRLDEGDIDSDDLIDIVSQVEDLLEDAKVI